MLRMTIKRIAKTLLSPIWTRVVLRLDQLLDARIAPLEADLARLSDREAEHADTLYRRMHAAELDTNHVPVLDGKVRDVTQRLTVLESAWREHAPYEADDAASLADLPASARKIYSELRTAIAARAND